VFVSKRCGKCREELPIEAFNRYRDGTQHWCRECFRMYFRARGDLHHRQVARSRRERQARLRKILLDHLRAHPCADCGEADLRVLELDHVLPRDEYVSRLVQLGVSPAVLGAEIMRCEVVCANCHRRRTARRGDWKRLRAEGQRPLHRKPFVDRNLRWIYQELRAAACVDCGLVDPLVLEHDHIGEKRESVMKMVHYGFSRGAIEREIAQCEVRCVNCHRRRTCESKAWFRSRALISEPPPP
jgi:ferredoxin